MVAERYEIDDTIGSGGMSVVYRAHDTRLDRYVTLKVLKEEYLTDESLMERFPKEARAAAALNHQNISSIFDHGRDGDILYIVLEYVDGKSLKELITKKAPFDDETTLGVTIQVAEGLAEAHSNGIIHLDIKPQNILISNASIVKVTDFGIARAAKNVTLNAGAGSMGSVHYFSPEQARGGYIDHKSDIYSLGIVMYEMATGTLPFEGESEVSIALQHINAPLPDILSINPKLSESMVKIIQKATEKSPSKRYQEIDDMTEDLKRALTDASGTFVSEEEDGSDAETRRISEKNREAIRRKKMRQAFLDGEDMLEEDEPVEDGGFLLRNSAAVPVQPTPKKTYEEGQEYGEIEEYQDYTFYAEDYDNPPPQPRDKKADRIAVYGGIILGLILAILIGLLASYLYNNIFSPTAGMVETPEVVGLPWAQAEIEAFMLGLQPHREDGYCNDFCFDCDGDCEGNVIYQRTSPGRLLSPGDVLHMVVSIGRAGERTIAPRVTNLTLDDALDILEALDLDLLILTTDYDDETIPRNLVVDQNPAANDMLTRGSTVVLTVSTGPEDGYVAMPNLVGSTEAQALVMLQEASLLPGASTRAYSDTFAVGQIIRQEPLPGESIERNSIVTYVISLGAEQPMPSPEPSPPPQETPQPNDGTPEQTPEPEATPTPTPTPTPTDEPYTPLPTPTPPPITMVSGTLEIHLGWQIPEGAETIHLVITRQIGNETPQDIINDPHAQVASFPRALGVEYADPTIFRIYSVENSVRIPRAVESRP